MKIQLIIHPIYTMQGLDFKCTNPKQKAFIKVNLTLGGHYYMQFHAADGLLASYIHFNANGAYTEDGLTIPKYCQPLLESANRHIASMMGTYNG